MPGVYEMLVGSSFYTGSLYSAANNGAGEDVAISSNSISTGSWGGLGNSWGASSDDLSGSLSNTMQTGVWGGLATTWGAVTIVTESTDRTQLIDSTHPNPSQGLALGEWDPFPIPPLDEEIQLPERDTTRFRKSYSSQRNTPQRLRLIKR